MNGVRRLAALVVLTVLASSCAYYNTFYLTKKYYMAATGGLPYQLEKPTGNQAGNYQKSVDYAKKVLANYPNSKWVDDAYLVWAKALLGKDDPLQTVNMLQDFSTRFQSSTLKTEATFYLGVGYRQGRKHREALVPLEEYLEKEPEGELAPYAHLERARALMSLDRAADAAVAASEVISRFPKSALVVQARAARAEALLASGKPDAARADFTLLGQRARDDNERFTYLLREADCLEAARDYAGELALLTSARSHEVTPVKTATGGAPTGVGADRYGQLTVRIGTLHLLAGRTDQALAAYQTVIDDYPKTPLAAEAQYRIAYAYETVLDDFERARQEYAKVRDQSASSAFFAQANVRQSSLDRLARYRTAGRDSLDRSIEADFLLAEQYLFQLDKPERALEAYEQIGREQAGTPWAAKALNAQAWVLRRKLDRKAEADSLLWVVVRDYPATESQLAARDYLESGGHEVPVALIKLPEPKLAVVDTALELTRPPEGSMPLGTVSPGASAGSVAPLRGPSAPPAPPATGASPPPTAGVARPGSSPLDDPPRPARDSVAPPPAQPDTSGGRP